MSIYEYPETKISLPEVLPLDAKYLDEMLNKIRNEADYHRMSTGNPHLAMNIEQQRMTERLIHGRIILKKIAEAKRDCEHYGYEFSV